MAIIDWSINILADTAIVMYTSNPVLLNGQVGKETDSQLFKIGDGTTPWNELPYAVINETQTVWVGISEQAGNLLTRSTGDGGIMLDPEKFPNLALLQQSLNDSSAVNAHDADNVLVNSYRMGILVRNLINSIGGDFTTKLKLYQKPDTTLMEIIQGIIDNGVDLSTILKDNVTATTSTWSSSKIDSAIALKVASELAILVGDAPETLDTIYKLAAALGENENLVTTIAADLANTVRFNNAQNLNDTQKTQARANIDAASATLVGTAASVDVDNTMINALMSGFNTSEGTTAMILPPIA